MPRKIVLNSVDLNRSGAIGVEFLLLVVDGDLSIPETNVRRAITADQDIEQHMDDLNAYFVQKGYPEIAAEDRETVAQLRELAAANPGMADATEAWLVQQEAQREAMEAPPVEEPAEGA